MYYPVTIIDNGLRLLVKGQGSSRYDLGQRTRGRATAVAGSNRASAPWQAFAAWVQIHARSLHI